MGVPKFYRWISERYPCLSEVVKEYQIPEFDNLYLDMNGIIHVCAHPNDDDPHFRITEEQIFKDIFHYIEVLKITNGYFEIVFIDCEMFLFHMIKPQKVFFMAVDGVAPRAKMNQQRGRRFRSAKDAEILENRAKERGEVLPTESRFDSNCITPGTVFMCRLHEQLKYFVTMKVSTDASWRDCKIYLSGHETPGEGEHKIMDFIRHQRSQSDYDPNTRHCLYGLDADLIMLGLCSHEPHFSLLREEVKYGKNQNRPVIPEQTTFHLLHLSLMREYLGHEFSALKTCLPFEYNLENIIDDWVLMGFLVGNDFIPNIPHLYIANEALPILYEAYIEVLPSLKGYINEQGYVNLERFEKFLKKLSEFDYKTFNDNRTDFKQMFGKGKRNKSKNSDNGFLDVLAKYNKEVPSSDESKLHEQLMDLSLNDDKEDSYYDDSEEDSDDSVDLCQAEFKQHKRDYYMNKLDYANVTPEVMKEQAYEYVRAIQWNLHYYYNGIASWSWYYPHHYSPYISDIKDFSEIDLHFDLGEPFLPFEQLLAVLPAASKQLLPLPFQKLMCDMDSPLKSFYPEDFKTDLNGKKQEWEAVVLIPFINERLLLESMKALEDELSDEEKLRNSHGPHMLYTYSENSLGRYILGTVGIFPPIEKNHARCVEIEMDYLRLPVEKIKKGLLENCKVDVFFPGFPTLKHIKHKAELKYTKVKVFQQASRGQNMMLIIEYEDTKPDITSLARKLLGECVYVNWPHLSEARVIGISDGKFQIVEDDNMETLTEEEKENFIQSEKESLTRSEKEVWKKQMAGVQSRYLERYGIETGIIEVLIHATILTGIRYICKNDSEVIVEKQWSSYPTAYALQAVVPDLSVHVTCYQRFKAMDDIYPVGSSCFMLGSDYYGEEAVIQPRDGQKKGRIRVKIFKVVEPSLSHVQHMKSLSSLRFMQGYILAQRLGISSFMLARMTGTVYVQTSPIESLSPNKSNIGLNLKFNKKNEEIPGYSKKQDDGTWLYSQNSLNIMKDYFKKFPDLFHKLVSVIDQDVVLVDDIFPDGDGRDYIHNVCSWIKSLPCSSIARQKCGASILEEPVVLEIEAAVKKLKEAPPSKSSTILQVKPHMLYRPVHMQAPSIPDASATYQLYDRVVNVRQGWTVPLGLRGTVIGIHLGDKPEDLTLDVVFDEEFAGGMALNCSANRGYTMSVASLMNLSHGKRKHAPKNQVELLQGETSQPQNNAKGKSRTPDTGVKSPKKSGRNELPPRLQAARQSTNQHANYQPFSGRSGTSSSGNGNRFNHSPDSPFVPHNVYSGQDPAFVSPSVERQTFVTPKVFSQSAQGYRHGPGFFKQPEPNFQSKSKNAAPTEHSSEFLAMWEGLKQVQFSNTNGQFPQPSKPTYGKQVSVEELFRSAMESESQQELKKRDPPPMKRNPVKDLMDYCSIHMKGGLPLYRHNPTGPMRYIEAEVMLPNGFRCRGVAAPNQVMASENAAEQALALLVSSGLGRGAQIRPSMPQPFSGASASQQPPVPMLGTPRFPTEMNVLRHPRPSLVSTIPDSYVEYNQRLAQHLQPHRSGPFYPSSHNQWNGPPSVHQENAVQSSFAHGRKQQSNATRFIPPQVSRNQAGKVKANKSKPSQQSKEANSVDSVAAVKTETVSSPKESSTAAESLPLSAQKPSSSTEQKEETPVKKRKSRLALKFN